MGNHNFAKSKIFVITVILIFSCAVMFFSCAAETPAAINLKDLVDAIGEKIDLSDAVEYSSEQIKNNYGITTEDAVEMIVLKKIDETNVSNAEVLIILQAHDTAKAKEIENKLKEHKTYKLKELENYAVNPDNERQYYIVDDSEMIIEGQYVFWAAHHQNKEINDIIKDYIKNNK